MFAFSFESKLPRAHVPCIALLTLAACLTSSVADAQATVVGRIASRGIVLRNDNGDPVAAGDTTLGRPTWVEYDVYGRKFPLGTSDSSAAGPGAPTEGQGKFHDLARSADLPVMSIQEYRSWITALSGATTPVLSAKKYNEEFTCTADDGSGLALKKTLKTSTASIVLRTNEASPRCSSAILFESPVASGADSLPRDTTTKTVVLQAGQIVYKTPNQIALETDFFTPNDDGPCHLDDSRAPTGGATYDFLRAENFVRCSPGKMIVDSFSRVWSPIAGATVELPVPLATRTDYTDTNGHYSVPYTTYATPFDLNIIASIRFQNFNSRIASSQSFMLVGTQAGSSQFNPQTTFNSPLSGVVVNTVENAAATHQSFVNIPVEVTNIVVRAHLVSVAPNVEPVDVTATGYPGSDGVAAQNGRTTYDEFTAPAVGAATPLKHILLSQIATPDLRDSDLYVFRMSDGQLLGSRWGLKDAEVDESGSIQTFAIMRGPATTSLGFASPQYFASGSRPPVLKDGKIVEAPHFGLELDYHDGTRTAVQAGDQLKVVMINRSTGYIGTALAKAVPENGVMSIVAASGGSISMEMRPPNLKITVRRTYKPKPELEDKERENTSIIGFEGSGLSTDVTVAIDTEWLDFDGSPLPPGLPGYTGRLAQVVLSTNPDSTERIARGSDAGIELQGYGNVTGTVGDIEGKLEEQHRFGSDPDHLNNADNMTGLFAILPNKKTQTVQLPDTVKDVAHFYVHVDAQPIDANNDFAGRPAPEGPNFSISQVCYSSCENAAGQDICGVGTVGSSRWTCGPRPGKGANTPVPSGPDAGVARRLGERPATFVPFLVPFYNKLASDIAVRQARTQHLPDPAPIYDWLYRPEMQFSLLELSNTHLMVADPNGQPRDLLAEHTYQVPESSDDKINLTYLLKQSAIPELERFGEERKLQFKFGNQLRDATLHDTTYEKTKNPDSITFDEPGAMGSLSGNDFLAVRLYQVGDEANTLWEYDFTAIKITLENGESELKAGDQVRAIATTSPPGQDVVWTLTKDAQVSGENTAAWIGYNTGMITVSPQSDAGYVKVRASLKDKPLVSAEIRVKIGCQCQACATNGNGAPNLSSVNMTWNIGSGRTTSTAGTIFLRQHTPGANLYKPSALEFSSLDLDTETVLAADTSVHQIVGPNAFVQIDALTDESYQLAFYDSSAKGDPDAAGFYAIKTGAVADVVWKVENPNPGSMTGLRLTETRGEVDKVSEYTWNEDLDDWTLTLGNGLVTEHHEETVATGIKTIRITKSDAHDISSVVEQTYQDFGWGSELVSEVVDPDGERLTSTTAYYDQEDDPEGAKRKVKHRINDDGSWTLYLYDDQGRVTSERSAWRDSTFPASSNQLRDKQYTYIAVDSADVQNTWPGGLEDKQESFEDAYPRVVTEETAGVVTAKTFYSYRRNTSSGEREVEEQRCTVQSCSWGSSTSLRTITQYYTLAPGQATNNQVKTVRHPDDTFDSYTYEYGTYHSNDGSFSSVPGAAIRTTVTHGTVGSHAGITGKTTREVSIVDDQGRAVRDETYVYAGGSTYELIGWTQRAYDTLGHLTQTARHTGEFETATWGCCAEESSTDSRGITTVYGRDALQRVGSTVRAGITTTYTYDGDGRQRTATRTAGALSLVSSTDYDSAGRLQSSTSEDGITTSYAYSSDGRTTTVTHADGSTEITTRFVDGRTKSVTGTAVVAQYFTYTVNSDGTQVTETHLGSSGSPVYERTKVDMLGRTIRVERPGYDGTTEVATTAYNAKGQAWKTTATGSADTVYQYDALGAQTRSELDVEGDGIQDLESGSPALASNDRISESETKFVKLGSQWWQETEQRVYADAEVATPVVTGKSRVRLTGFTSGVVSEQVAIDLQGNETRSTVTVTRDTSTETRTTDTPDSDVNAVSVTTIGRLVSSTSATGLTTTFGYDGLGRRTSVVDPRTGTSTTHYDSHGRVDVVTDAASNATTFAYDTLNGRMTSETNALGKKTYLSYTARGELERTWGDVPYPVEYGYDDYGRRETMKTFRSGDFTDDTWPTGVTGDTTTWHYEEATGLLLSKEDAASEEVSYTYGPAGRLETRTWARPKSGGGALTTTYGYDAATGELLTVNYNDSTPDVTYTYDRLGRQDTVEDGQGSRTFAYDPSTLQLSTETMTGLTAATLTRSYATSGVKGRPTGMALGSDYAVTYGYDAKGRFETLGWDVNDEQDLATYTRATNSELLSGYTTTSGQVVAYGYEAHRDLKTQVQNKWGSTVVSQFDYAYDEISRRTSVKNSGSAFAASAFTKWGYDDRNQVVDSDRFLGTTLTDTSSPVHGEDRAFEYDPIGNRSSSTINTTSTSYTATALNQYSAVGSASPSYDDDGNMTSDGTKTLVYNAENQLVSVAPASLSSGDKRVTFVYDFMGRRVKKTVETYSGSSWSTSDTKTWVYSGWNKVQETKVVGATTTTKNFVWGLDLAQSTGGAGGIGGLIAAVNGAGHVSLFTYDGNGNVGELLDASDGSMDAHYEYDAFGNVVTSSGAATSENAWRFSTKYADDETGLVYYGYRYYEPDGGRWTQRDPLGEDGGVALYGFVQNNAVFGADAYGLWLLYNLADKITPRDGGRTRLQMKDLPYFKRIPDAFKKYISDSWGFQIDLQRVRGPCRSEEDDGASCIQATIELTADITAVKALFKKIAGGMVKRLGQRTIGNVVDALDVAVEIKGGIEVIDCACNTSASGLKFNNNRITLQFTAGPEWNSLKHRRMSRTRPDPKFSALMPWVGAGGEINVHLMEDDDVVGVHLDGEAFVSMGLQSFQTQSGMSMWANYIISPEDRAGVDGDIAFF